MSITQLFFSAPQFLFGIICLCLVAGTPKLAGRGWLVGAVVLSALGGASNLLTTSLLYLSVEGYMTFEGGIQEIYHWPRIFSSLISLQDVCWAFFLFALWREYRRKPDITASLFSPKGRISRSTFAVLFAILYLASVIPMMQVYNHLFDYSRISHGLDDGTAPSWPLPRIAGLIVSSTVMLIIDWVRICVFAKRWHDHGKSGWNTLLLLVPVLGIVYFFTRLLFGKGDEGRNEFGSPDEPPTDDFDDLEEIDELEFV